jgi:hypothetical protein
MSSGSLKARNKKVSRNIIFPAKKIQDREIFFSGAEIQ